MEREHVAALLISAAALSCITAVLALLNDVDSKTKNRRSPDVELHVKREHPIANVIGL